MPEKIIVLGGSFNPPTKTHKALLEHAVKAMNADLGIYVPSSGTYVSRKNARTGTPSLSEYNRLRLLRAMCGENMTVSTCEYGDTSRGRTLKTLAAIRDDHLSGEIHLILGWDKLDVFHRWPTRERILEEFRILWLSRDASVPFSLPDGDPLKKYESQMTFLKSPKETDGVSSSLFWKKYGAEDPSAWDLIDPAAAGILKEILSEKGGTK